MEYLKHSKKAPKEKTISFRVSDELWKDLKFYCWKHDTSMTEALAGFADYVMNQCQDENINYERHKYEIENGGNK